MSGLGGGGLGSGHGQPSYEYIFCGFPGAFVGCEDILRQVSVVLELWNQLNKFPIRFEPMYMGSQVVDETLAYTIEIT